jgi:hypothetical protein
MKQWTMWLLALGVAIVTDAGAQQYVYPAKGQSPEQQAQQQQQAGTQQQAAFAKARAACLEGRGYTVK